MFKHHLVEGSNGKVTIWICIFHGGNGCVQTVSLMAKWWVLHGNHFECVLIREEMTYDTISNSETKQNIHWNGRLLHETFWKCVEGL